MSTNYVQPGKVLDYTNATAAAIPMGSAVAMGSLVAVVTAGNPQFPGPLRVGDTGSVQICGVFRLPKVSADVITQGALVYLVTASGAMTVTAAGNTLAGRAVAAAGNGATSVNVLMNSVPA